MMPMVGGEAAGRFEDFGNVLFIFGLIIQLQLHHLAELLRFGAVNGKHQGFLQEGIVNGGQIGVERNDALATRLVGEGNQLPNRLLRIDSGFEENLYQLAEGGDDHRHGILQEDGAQGSAKDNNGGRRL